MNDGTPLPAATLEAALASDAVFLTALSAATNSTPSFPASVPKRDCCSFVPRWAGSPICALPSHSRNSLSTALFALRSLRAPTFFSFVNCSAVFTSERHASGTARPVKPGTRCATRAMKSPASPALPFSLRLNAARSAYERRQSQCA